MAANDNNIPGMAGCLVAALYTDSLANKVDNAQGFVAKQATFTTAMMMSGGIHSQCIHSSLISWRVRLTVNPVEAANGDAWQCIGGSPSSNDFKRSL